MQLYLPIALGILVFLATASMLVVQFSQRIPTQLRWQVLSWWRIWPWPVAALLWFPVGWYALLVMLLGLSALELKRFAQAELKTAMASSDGRTTRTASMRTLLFTAGTSLLAIGLGWLYPDYSAALFVLSLLTLLGFIYRPQFPLLAASIWLGIGIGSLWQLAQLPSPQALRWLGFLLIITALNDVAQYLVGRPCGRHRIAPVLSPNKTWQGLLGGIAISALLSLLIGTQLQLAAHSSLLWLGALLSVSGFFGDLAFSALKRHAGIKDFSDLLPGHGGLLDRIDSLMFTAPLLWFVVQKQWI